MTSHLLEDNHWVSAIHHAAKQQLGSKHQAIAAVGLIALALLQLNVDLETAWSFAGAVSRLVQLVIMMTMVR